MTELQTEATEVVNESPIELTPQEGAAPAPASDENHETKIEFSEEQQAHINDLMGKKTFKLREAERKYEAEQAELKRQLEEAQALITPKARPDIPVIDPYSDTYEQDLVARDEAVRAQAKYDEDQNKKADLEKKSQAQQLQSQQEENARLLKAYNDRATQLGVNAAELQAAENAVVNYGIAPEVGKFIFTDDQGPLIVKYLAKNPLEMEVLRGLDPQRAAIRIHSEIRQKAALLGVKTPTAPAPVDTLTGSGAPHKERGPKGATFT